jgi:hypothetical protein
MTPMNEVTRILSGIEAGDPHAAAQLLPLVYDELRKRGAARLAEEVPGNTLLLSSPSATRSRPAWPNCASLRGSRAIREFLMLHEPFRRIEE